MPVAFSYRYTRRQEVNCRGKRLDWTVAFVQGARVSVPGHGLASGDNT